MSADFLADWLDSAHATKRHISGDSKYSSRKRSETNKGKGNTEKRVEKGNIREPSSYHQHRNQPQRPFPNFGRSDFIKSSPVISPESTACSSFVPHRFSAASVRNSQHVMWRRKWRYKLSALTCCTSKKTPRKLFQISTASSGFATRYSSINRYWYYLANHDSLFTFRNISLMIPYFSVCYS